MPGKLLAATVTPTRPEACKLQPALAPMPASGAA